MPRMKRTQTSSAFTNQQKLAIEDWLELGKPIERLPYVQPDAEDTKPKQSFPPRQFPKTEAEKKKAHDALIQKHAEQEAEMIAEIKHYVKETKGKQTNESQ